MSFRYIDPGRAILPVSILVHHALADGLHIARFYENLRDGIRGFADAE